MRFMCAAVVDPCPTPALTVRQPYAGLIISGVKDVENRSWQVSYRGRLAVHAGMQRDTFSADTGITCTMRVRGQEQALALDEVHGALLGWVTLADIVTGHPSPWAIQNIYHWVLTDPVVLDEALPMRGKQGLWTYHGAP